MVVKPVLVGFGDPFVAQVATVFARVSRGSSKRSEIKGKKKEFKAVVVTAVVGWLEKREKMRS